jgi:2-polyprenyl-6-methoxyphenol hydroxylase-like FAD-dependent oxidoreductase
MFGTDTIVKYVVIFILGIAGLVGANHLMNLKADLAVAEANTKTLKDSMILQGQVIAKQEQEIMQKEALTDELRKRNEELDKQVKTLDKKFNVKANGNSRDFGAIAAAKPEVDNKLVDKATNNVNRCFEIATGAKLKEGETNAECKDLANSSTK